MSVIKSKLNNQTSGEILHIQLQTQWKDEFDRPIGAPGPWQTIVLTPGQSAVYNQTSPTPDAVLYNIRIRYSVPQTSAN